MLYDVYQVEKYIERKFLPGYLELNLKVEDKKLWVYPASPSGYDYCGFTMNSLQAPPTELILKDALRIVGFLIFTCCLLNCTKKKQSLIVTQGDSSQWNAIQPLAEHVKTNSAHENCLPLKNNADEVFEVSQRLIMLLIRFMIILFYLQ